ncbi:MAG TPA: ABC transporter permease [Bryobacteraceae bacterium]
MRRFVRFFRRARRDAESARDIEFYIATETEDNIARGMPPEAARTAALRKFGNPTLVREDILRLNSIPFLETTAQDLRYSLRALCKTPAFTVTALLTLALGIGGNTAVFTLIRGVLLKPLEYRDPDRLVYFSIDNLRHNQRDLSFSRPQFDELRAAAKSFTLGAYGRPENIMLSKDGDPEALKGARVSANFLGILGMHPILGRSFRPEEDRRSGASVAMISADLWKRRFGGDPSIAGQTATLDATPYTIIGVLPEGFSFPFPDVDVWVTRPSEWSLMAPRYWDLPLLNGFARLRPGFTLAQAQAEMNVLQRQYAASHPSLMSPDRGETMRVIWLKDHFVSEVRPMLWTLFGAVGFVLLIACANVASLLLARSTFRSREFAIRAALGAGRRRLIRQLLAESLVLAAVGGVLGVLLTKWVLSTVRHISPLSLPRAPEIRLDGMVLAFSIVVSIVAGVLFGLFPSFKSSRPDLADELRESGAAAGGRELLGRRGVFGLNARGLLVVSQIALSIVLLIGAALLMQSFLRLHRVDPGFQSANLLTAKIALPPARYDTDQKRFLFFRELLSRLEGLPGVSGAAMAMSLPSTTWIRTNILAVEGKPPLDPGEVSSYGVWQSVTPGYFHTLGIRLKRGREFTARDNVMGAPPVMMVNETMACILWPHYSDGENPIGRHVKEAYDKSVGWMEVVGIVADIHEAGLANTAVPEFYLPCALHPPQTPYLVVRTAGDPLHFAGAIRRSVLAIDHDQPISDVKTMEAVLTRNFGQRRLAMLLLGSFAGVALLLAVIGLYGIVAYSVARRTQEVGIRRALGAQQADILRLVLRQALALSLAGVAIGIAGAFALTRFLKALLFHVTATDPAAFVATAFLFILVALAASYIPARRAARIDPMTALRIG